MEGIFKILENEGIQIPEESKKILNKKIASEYKTIAEFSSLSKKYEDANAKISEFSNIINERDSLKTKNQELSKLYEDSKVDGYKLAVSKRGVDDDFIDFVTDTVLKKVDGNTDFNTALESFIKDNKKYMSSNPKLTLSTTPTAESKADFNSINEIMNKFIRSKGR